jgi:TonB family protein
MLLARQGRLEDAVRELDAAKRLNFREVEARTELGLVLLRLGREEEALVELRDVLRIDRHATRAYVGVGTILARRDRLPEAITAYQNAIQVDARYGPAHLGLAEVFDRAGRPGEAWGAAEQAHDLGEDVPAEVWLRLAGKHPPAPPLPPMCQDAGGGPGSDLDNPDPVYRSYATRVRERVRAHVTYPRVARERGTQGETRVEIRFAPTGRVECVAVRRSSGSELLDRYLLSAVRLAQPFPPPPPQLAAPLSVSGAFPFGMRDPTTEAPR